MKRVLSIIIVALIALSMFAFASCSKQEEQDIPDGFVAVTNAQGETVTDKDGNVVTVTKGTLEKYEDQEYATIYVPYTNEQGQTYTNENGHLATFASRVPVTSKNNTTTHNTTIIGGNDPAVQDIF